MKSEILKTLRKEEGKILSGNKLSKQLKTTRVTVWKHIKKLQESGYDIKSTSKGYVLLSSPDVPFPWEFPHREGKLFHYASLSSTMDKAREHASKGCGHMTIIVADSQKNGRGRLKRQWITTDGGLYFTLVLKPNCPPAYAYMYNFAASVSLVHALKETSGVICHVKWPNDILANEKKLCGMLSEMEAETDMISFLNIGIGLNVNNDVSMVDQKAVSVKEIIGKKANRKIILESFLNHFEKLADNIQKKDIITQWKKHTVTIGKHVRVKTVNDEYLGEAVDIDQDGALILKLETGSTKKVIYGDCYHN